MVPHVSSHLLLLPLTPRLVVHQDKLSAEVQKQHGGPEEAQVEPDGGPGTDPDASLAEEDKTKPLLERLKALEVRTLLVARWRLTARHAAVIL